MQGLCLGPRQGEEEGTKGQKGPSAGTELSFHDHISAMCLSARKALVMWGCSGGCVGGGEGGASVVPLLSPHFSTS